MKDGHFIIMKDMRNDKLAPISRKSEKMIKPIKRKPLLATSSKKLKGSTEKKGVSGELRQ